MATSTIALVSVREPNAVTHWRPPSTSDIQRPPPTAVHNQLPPNPPPLNLPRGDLLAEGLDYINTCLPLYNASINGDWEAANRILSRRKELVRFSITENHETALHIAASAQNNRFVEELLKRTDTEDLVLQNKNGNTALCLAALSGNKELTEILVKKNRGLLTIPGSHRMMPLYMAALSGNHGTVKYLYDNSQKMTGDNWTSQNQGWVLLKCVEVDLFGIALRILEDCPKLARTQGVLEVLARKPEAFNDSYPRITIKSCFRAPVQENTSEAMQLLKMLMSQIMKLPKADINFLLKGSPDPAKKDEKRTYSSRVLFVAAEVGNSKFIVELIRQYPDVIWKLNDNNQSIFHIAVSHRHASVYNLLHEIGPTKDILLTPLKDHLEGNNMLHLVGKSAEIDRLHHVSGEAFKMQWELLWFKEVEAMVPFTSREKKNKAGKTPRELFSENHRELLSKGEKWIKETANQCMVVAALLATIVFGVAFSIPGGYDQTTGFPMFISKKIYIAFVISDAISLIFSSASILMFLSILTSRYDEHDFFESLPKKLMIGLATLFLSIMTMMVAFSLSFFVLYHNKLIWVPIVISVVAAFPVILYAKLQYSLLVDVYTHSIYGSRYIFKPKKRMLYNQIPKF